MKIILTLLLLVALCVSAMAQETKVLLTDIETYQRDSMSPQFGTKFPNQTDKTDYKRLREFLEDQKKLLKVLQDKYDMVHNSETEFKDFKNQVGYLRREIKGKAATDTVLLSRQITSNILYFMNGPDNSRFRPENDGYLSGDKYKYFVEQVQSMIVECDTFISENAAAVQRHLRLGRNIEVVKQDISSCEVAIEQALTPEYADQAFRRQISLYFSILIGILLIGIFVVIIVRPTNDITKTLLSSSGLQFITIFVLIIAVILFGILGILQSSELAAILSGISGYILGKGISNRKGNAEAADPASTEAPAADAAAPAQDAPAG